MRLFLSMLLSMAALLALTMTYAQTSESAAAENLIRAMGMDQFAVQGTLALYLQKPHAASRDALTDRQRQDFVRCMERSDRSSIVHALADVLARQMSPDEMMQALAFYNSPAGKKQVQQELAEAQRMLGYGFAAASPELSGEEKASLDQFRGTSAYAKLEGFPARIKESRGTYKAIFQWGESAAATCLRAVGLTRR